MIIHVYSLTFSGVDIIPVDVQVHLSSGIPAFTIVGLADKTIAESRERVRAALSAIGLSLPPKKILVNLAPADLMKEGSHFDLAIAAALLAAMSVLPSKEIEEYLIIGELSLDGKILPVSGALPAAIGANTRDKGLICSIKNGAEAAWSGNKKIIAPESLLQLINHFKGTQVLSCPEPGKISSNATYSDMKDIKGQDIAKRALEIAASGAHNLIMSGSPGTGKSMLAQRLPSILPDMSADEILECSTISSIAGEIKSGELSALRPFRAPHHSCSLAAMVGGGVGRRVKPGEVSIAHNGVLFLDELPEFPPSVIESLRQPLEDREVLISRSGSYVKFPARFQLIAAMNPCKCGYLGDSFKECSKAPKCGSDYKAKISGPILDRFDLNVEVGATGFSFDHNELAGESSAQVRARVIKVRDIQTERYQGYGIRTNSQLEGDLLTEYAFPSDGSIDILNESANKFRLSMRAYNKILKVARTIADMDDSKGVKKIHLAEALSYRNFEFN